MTINQMFFLLISFVFDYRYKSSISYLVHLCRCQNEFSILFVSLLRFHLDVFEV